MKKEEKPKINRKDYLIRIEPDILHELRVIGAQKGLTLPALIRWILGQYVYQKTKKQEG